ncbi:hypothetical protein [Jiulongibacter sediminis]|jgi:hypothetical protein|uniref:hypothetical protein n=1 Tax=Jiulongibacter sediminis TaxID=1605367 RepID=UPI0026EE35AB|nr:hypothetical protein [Jiulongibacter sediminis]
MKISSFFTLFILSSVSLTSCNKTAQSVPEFENLSPGQSKFVVRLDDDFFYEDDAVFNGTCTVRDNFFGTNLFNQYGGNIMITFQEDKWYNKSYLEGEGGQTFSTLMIGKVIDKSKNLGAGYLMTEGKIFPKEVSKEKIYLEFEGKVKRYPKVDAQDPSYEVSGFLLMKSPDFTQYSVEE